MIRAEVPGETVPANRLLKHPAQCNTVHDPSADTKTNDTACELVHHYENPVGSQVCRFAPEQITAPQTVLRVAEKGEPGRLRLATEIGPLRQFNLAHPKLLILRGGGFGLSYI
jgi:hypothetical protein